MLNIVARCAALILLLLPATSVAEPVKLKLAYFTSDRTPTYQAGIKPFIDAVNTEGRGSIEIEPHVSGALGKDPATQLQVLLSGAADIAFIVPGLVPERFPGTSVIELPGLFRDGREATLAHTKLAVEKRLKAYDDFIVIGAYASDPETIHARSSITSIKDLNGLRTRVNNAIEAEALDRLGMKAVVMPVNKVAVAISGGVIDAAAVPPNALFQFGISRVANHHYLLGISAPPFALLMTRKRFETLPKKAQDVIVKFSGRWTGERYGEIIAADNRRLLKQLRDDPKRTVVTPLPADLSTATAAYDAVTREWEAQSADNKALLETVRTEIRNLRLAE